MFCSGSHSAWYTASPARGQPHEQVIAQQVTLGEPQAGVVQGLEDPVRIVAVLSSHRDQGQARDDRIFDALDVGQVVRIVTRLQLGPEEAVRGTDRVSAARLRRGVQAGEVRGTVGLGGNQLEPVLFRLPSVDQVLLVDPISVLRAPLSAPGDPVSRRAATTRWSAAAGRPPPGTP